MRSPHIVATFALAGLSTGLTIARVPAHTSSLTPVTTPTEASSPPGLSQPDIDDWHPVFPRDAFDTIEDIISAIIGGGDETTTVTAPGSVTTVFLTGGPETTTGPVTVTSTVTREPHTTTDSYTVTSTVTEPSWTTVTNTGTPGTISAPVTVTTTAPQAIVTTTIYTPPFPTDSAAPTPTPVPGESGCHFAQPDGSITVGPCGPNPFKFVLPSPAS